MRLLVIDTTGEMCSAALRQPGAADMVVSERIGRGHAERLAPMVDALLQESACTPGDLDRVGVTTGPGSFAGVRVGVAFARGLSLATGAEAVGISTLAVWANTGDMPDRTDVWAVHDARRGDLVLQHFSRGQAVEEPEVLAVNEAAARLEAWFQKSAMEPLVLTGSGAHLVPSTRLPSVTTDHPADLDLSVLLDLAGTAPKPDGAPSPFYARPPDAKLPGGVSP